jgi:phosphoserine phosphatase RsbU/P
MADNEDKYHATMRIEIPPELRAQLEAGKKPVTETASHGRAVIRIPKTQPVTPPLGDADFLELLQSIYDAALITDLNGRIISANTRASQFFLRTAEELCRLNILDIISGADPSVLTTILETLESDRFVLIQAFCNRKDGTVFPAEISINRLRISARDHLSLFVRDVTLRRAAEEELRTGYTAIRNAGGGIVIANVDANVQYANPSLLRLLQFEADEDLQGRNIRDFFCDRAAVEGMIQAVKRRENQSRETEAIRKDGSKLHVQVSAAPNVNSDGDLVGIVLSLLDISNLKLAQSKLQEYAGELRQKNLQMEDDLNMAREIQLASLATDYPVFPAGADRATSALRFSHLYLPSGIVGGDFFDILRISDTEAGILIADVVGHGTRAALVVATMRGLIEQLAGSARDPGEFLTKLNQAYASIFKQMEERMFATAFYSVIDLATGQCRHACAGHPPPFRLRRDRGVVEALEFRNGSRGPALGLYEDSVYRFDGIALDVGDLMLLYTDGLSEADNAQNEYYDVTRMPACLARDLKLPPERLLQDVVADARQFSGREHFEDDVCLLAVELHRLVDQHPVS